MEILIKTEVHWKSLLDVQKRLHNATYSYHQDSVEERFTELWRTNVSFILSQSFEKVL